MIDVLSLWKFDGLIFVRQAFDALRAWSLRQCGKVLVALIERSDHFMPFPKKISVFFPCLGAELQALKSFF